ncbi:helix-turn-helix transcriptional regulator [Natronolimnobius sp. AArcel1]|uniref:helix-turn-helix transcriptional regulator n=1 Tax=Natronolimnobius sp. AArcel1 TaxID=1679093 RepID=UPI0013EA39C3|nr:helix-turn-helix transcriptional regulator [Natronolimnobius sp. AArcel1]NGM71231.1 helix-turn-helix transcriptional regulator [Natronolimnobius sp. AArcel1]
MSVQTSRSESLAESEVFHILGNDRRRAIVQLLARESAQIDVSDVATEIAETESDSASVPNNLYKSVYVSLQQTHLPQLEEDGVIEYDSDAKTIQAGPNFDDVLAYINGHTDDPSTFLQLHFAACVLGLAVIALIGLDIPLLSSIDPVLWSVGVLLAVAASSLYRLLS